MINPEELRIGNWVDTPDDGYIKITQIGEYGARAWQDMDYNGNKSFKHNSPDKNDYDYEDLTGISLSPEILEKYGFDDFGKNSFVNGNIKIGFTTLTNTVSWVAYYDHHLSLYSMDYLHELQNLYFILTGNELEIKL